jgi:hypothetical protein
MVVQKLIKVNQAEALVTFNQVMATETFSLLDDEKQSSLETTLAWMKSTRLDS